MRVTKKIIAVAITVSCIFLGFIYSNATSQLEAVIETDQKELRAKEEINLTLNLTNYKTIKPGIYAYQAVLNYDENVFDKVEQSNFVCENEWTDIQYNPENHQFVVINKVPTTEEEEVISVKLFVKEDAKQGKTSISVNNAYVSDGKKQISMLETAKEVNIIQDKAHAYDRDSNKSDDQNKYQDIEILSDKIEIAQRLYEMKDIQYITLYKQKGDEVEIQSTVDINDLNDLSQYMVSVEMKDLPSFYTTIKETKVEDGVLKLVLDYDNVVQYIGNQKQNHLEVVYGKVNDNTAVSDSLSYLIEEIKKNPSGHFVLTQDLDASILSDTSSKVYFDGIEFSGTLDGNGHKIYNITKPLFNKMENATIQNLVIENASIKDGRGVLSNEAISTQIMNVHVKDVQIIGNGKNSTGQASEEIGALVGTMKSSSEIKQSSVTNLTLTASLKRAGGLVGALYDSHVTNSYVTGKMTYNKDSVGGIAGYTSGECRVEYCIIDIEMNAGGSINKDNWIGGIVGDTQSQKAILKSNLSLVNGIASTNRGYRITGNTVSKKSSNNYELADSTLTTNYQTENSYNADVKQVTKDKLKSIDFYKSNLGFDETIWNFASVTRNGKPTLKQNDPNYFGNLSNSTGAENIYIPDYQRLKDIIGYDDSKDIAYHNLYLLMPYYDAKYLIEDGMKIANNHILNSKVIKEIYPFDDKGEAILALTSNSKNTISKLKIIFEDDSVEEYQVSYQNTIGSIVNYEFDDLEIGYNFNKYLVDTDSSLFTSILERVKSTNYESDIDPVTEETEARNYTENYPNVLAKADSFIMKLLANNSEYNMINDNTVIKNKILSDLNKDKMLEKILYTYNYFDRFYNIEIGGINMTDILFFDGSIFNDNLNSINMTKEMIAKEVQVENNGQINSERMTKNLPAYYNNTIKPYTSLALGDFLEYFIKNLTEDKYKQDPTRWFVDVFDGYVYEAESEDFGTSLEYRAWEHMKRRELLILPMLTYHGNDLYIMSYATGVSVGNLRMYYDNFDSVPSEKIEERLKLYADRIARGYNTIAHLVSEDTIAVMNSKTHIGWDSTNNKNLSGQDNIDPVYKYFNEVINVWPTHSSAGAYANMTDVMWMYRVLDSYNIFTHENIHNQDNYMYLEGNGKRLRIDFEYFADGLLTQGKTDSGYVPNFAEDYSMEENVATNFTRDRIDTKEKYKDFYSKMFETLWTLEYLEGQAFLQLTPEEQSVIARQFNYTNISEQPKNLRTTKDTLTAEEFENMKLKTMEDLYDNRIFMERGWYGVTAGNYWFSPQNEHGMTDESFRRTAYEMAANGGYDAFVDFASAKYNTDLEVLRVVMNDPNITWKQYQMNKYDNIKEKVSSSYYFDDDELIELFKNTMKLEAKVGGLTDSKYKGYGALVRQVIYTHLKRVTNDFRTSIYENPNVVQVQSATDLINKIKETPYGIFELTSDIDFTGVTSQENAYIMQTFFGELNGNNHSITGLSHPLFNSIQYGTIKNLNIKDSVITSTTAKTGSLSNTASYLSLTNVNASNVTVSGTTQVGGLIGETTRSIFDGGIVTTTVKGSGNEVGGAFGKIETSIISNFHAKETKVSGTGRVGGLIGIGNTMYNIKNSTANTQVNAMEGAIGGLAGQLDGSKLENSYALGKVVGKNDVGGLVGYASRTNISNSFANVSSESTNANSVGGFIGQSVNGTIVTNNIALGNTKNGYKFDGRSGANLFSNYSNNYEYKESRGTSTLNRNGIDFNGKVTVADTEKISTTDFYSQTLKWDLNIWDLSNVEKGGLPKLKNLDPNNVTAIIEKTEIKTVDDFIRINEVPDAIYELKADIDFANYEVTDNTIITKDFSGTIEGNGYTLSNMKASLFNKINDAKIENLKIVNGQNIDNQSKGILANEISNSTLNKIYVDKIKVVHNNGMVGGLAGHIKQSTIQKISLLNIDVTADNTVGGLAGQINDSTIENILVTGKINGKNGGNNLGARAGGITGWYSGNTMDKCITKVEITSPRIVGNGGIIGGPNNGTPNISNSMSLSTGKAYRISGFNVLSNVTNVYELTTSNSTTNMNDGNIGKVNLVTEEDTKDTSFYKNSLVLDETIWDLSKVSTLGYPTLK